MAMRAVALLAAAGADAALYASIRADMWNPDFPVHGTSDPVDGRRIHIVADAAVASDADLQSVTIDGQEGLNLSTAGDADLTYYDWLRAHVNPTTQQVWISLHTRHQPWQQGARAVRIVKRGGAVVVNGTVAPAAASGLELSYATTRQGHAEAVLHIHSTGKAPAALTRLTYDGKEVAFPKVTVPIGGHVVVVVPGVAKRQGDVWTVTLSDTTGATNIAYGGRVMPERFPIEVWPHSSDCPLPAPRPRLRSLQRLSLARTTATRRSCGRSALTVFFTTGTTSSPSAASRGQPS
eukprot:TRINITY_DN4177_c0_g1_i1.p1 TRINITY_DN4177_c0_g1~~TRINITY_DN4177_c0_g1_i1.p1  ORF type:complete len:309 (+),score=70.01 TRINITY_DN4177_c0_g1_i1:50-928(+)